MICISKNNSETEIIAHHPDGEEITIHRAIAYNDQDDSSLKAFSTKDVRCTEVIENLFKQNAKSTVVINWIFTSQRFLLEYRSIQTPDFATSVFRRARKK